MGIKRKTRNTTITESPPQSENENEVINSEVSELEEEDDSDAPSIVESDSSEDESVTETDESEQEDERDGASAADSDFSEDERENENEEINHEDSKSEGEDERDAATVAESDSSEDEVAPRNTIGDVPLEWYKDEPHIGYDIKGKKITKKERQDKLDSFLANADDSKNWRKIYDEYNDEMVELTREEVKIIRRLRRGKAPHAEFDPYEPSVDWFKWEDAKHPLSNAPEPKRRFIPSKWEQKAVVRLVRGIREGRINPQLDKPKETPGRYMLWGDDSGSTDKSGHSYIPAPKSKPGGHEESYNPSAEYIPTQEEINAYQLMDEEDQPKFIPKRFTSFRSIPAYEKLVNEVFERLLDLYLCPRVRKKRVNINPEFLKPKLPNREDLKPYPVACYLEYRGHTAAVMSVSVDTSGQWIASGSIDGTVRVWEVETGRCLKTWEIGEAVKHVAWNPERPILAVTAGEDVFLLNTELGNDQVQKDTKELLHIKEPANLDDQDNKGSRWLQDEEHGGIKIRHFRSVSSVDWHRKGDYFSAVLPNGQSKAVLVHQLSKKLTQVLRQKLHGLPVSSAFHPTSSEFFVATKKNVRVFDLLKRKPMKTLESGLREISSIAVHPEGDNIIVGSKEGKLCWFDRDLSSKPYRVLTSHPKDITNVAFHRKYPLFASSSDDGTAYVFHGMVYRSLDQNPLIVPLEILRGHVSTKGRGVLDCKFHPQQPWLFTAGADSVIRLYCH